MPDEHPSLHIDTDWKKQAQEEKRRLAEDEQKRAAEREDRDRAAGAVTMPGAANMPGAAASAGGAESSARGASRGEREVPPASISTLISSLMTQVLLYLGDWAPRGAQPQVNLDMAKFNIDLLGALEEKTRGNLSAEEQRILDSALYETRMRYVSVASQYATV
jgi:hypothetical protein